MLDSSLFRAETEKDEWAVGLYLQAKLRDGEACPSLCTERHLGCRKFWFRKGREGGLCGKDLGPEVLLCSLKHSLSVPNTIQAFHGAGT